MRICGYKVSDVTVSSLRCYDFRVNIIVWLTRVQLPFWGKMPLYLEPMIVANYLLIKLTVNIASWLKIYAV